MSRISKMVERVARAICTASHIPDNCGWTPEEVRDFEDDNWHQYVEESRAAIAAMSEVEA